MDTRIPGAFHSFPAQVDVALHTAGQARHLYVARLLCYPAYRLEIAGAGCRKTGFNNVNTQHFQLMGKAQLFLQIHGRAGRLFAIAQGCVKKIYMILHISHSEGHGIHNKNSKA